MANASPAPLRRPQVASPSPVKPVTALTHDDYRPVPPAVDPGDDWSFLEPTLPIDSWQPGTDYHTDPQQAARRKVSQVQARIDRDLQGVRQAIELRRQEQPWSIFGDDLTRTLKRAESSLEDARQDARDVLEALDNSRGWDTWDDWSRRDLDRARDNLDDLSRELGDAQRHLDDARRLRPDYGNDYGYDPRNPLDPNPYDNRYGRDKLGTLIDTVRRDVATAARETRDARENLGGRDTIPVDPWPRPIPPTPWPFPTYPDRPNPRPPRNPIPTDPWPRPGRPVPPNPGYGDRPNPGYGDRPNPGNGDRPNPRPPRGGTDPYPAPGRNDRPTPPPIEPAPGRPGTGDRPGGSDRPVPPPVNSPDRPNPRPPRR